MDSWNKMIKFDDIFYTRDNNRIHTSFSLTNCHMDKLTEELLDDDQFSIHVAVLTSRRQISTPYQLKWFKV